MFLDKLQAHKKVKDGRDANGPEEPHENGLPHLLNLVDPFVHAKHPRQASKEEDQSTKNDEAPGRGDGVVAKVVPGYVRAVPQEDGDIEEHVDCRLQGVILGLQPEPVIPCKRVARDEAGEDIIGANEATRAQDK